MECTKSMRSRVPTVSGVHGVSTVCGDGGGQRVSGQRGVRTAGGEVRGDTVGRVTSVHTITESWVHTQSLGLEVCADGGFSGAQSAGSAVRAQYVGSAVHTLSGVGVVHTFFGVSSACTLSRVSGACTVVGSGVRTHLGG